MKVKSDLQALLAGEGKVAGTTAVAMSTLRTLLRAGHGGDDDAEDAGRVPREPQTITEVYKETYQTLLRYCDVIYPSEVAPVWARLANCHKTE